MAAKDQTSIRTRQLGKKERILHVLQKAAGLVASQTLHVRGSVEPDALRAVLSRMQARFPLLGARIFYQGFGFVPNPPFIYPMSHFTLDGTTAIPLDVVENATPDAWRARLRTELATPLGRGRQPRIRVVLLRHEGGEAADLIIVTDHAIADAQAASRLGNDLLLALAGLLPEDGPVGMDGLPPALEDRYQPRPATEKRAFQPAIRLPIPRGKGPIGTDVFEVTLSAEDTKALSAAARANRSSLHGAVSAAFMLALKKRYGLDAQTLLTNVEFRRLCKPAIPADTFGCYVDILRSRHPVEGDIWAVARNVNMGLLSALSNDQEGASVLKVPSVATYWPERRTLTSGLRIDALSVTTAGEVPFARTYGKLTLEHVTSAVSLKAIGPNLFVVGAQWDGEMRLTVCYATPMLGEADVAAITADALAELKAAIAG